MKKHMMALATIFTLCTGAFTTNAFAAEHKIEKGETLSEISEQYSMNVEDLKNLNDLSSDLIIANEILSVLDESDFYSIQKGDTLFEIGQAKKATVEQLMEWNNLSTEIIFAGDILAVTVEAGKQLMNEQATQSAELKTNKETKTEVKKELTEDDYIDGERTIVVDPKEAQGQRYNYLWQYAAKLYDEGKYKTFQERDGIYYETLDNLVKNYDLKLDKELFKDCLLEYSEITFDVNNKTGKFKDFKYPTSIILAGC